VQNKNETGKKKGMEFSWQGLGQSTAGVGLKGKNRNKRESEAANHFRK